MTIHPESKQRPAGRVKHWSSQQTPTWLRLHCYMQCNLSDQSVIFPSHSLRNLYKAEGPRNIRVKLLVMVGCQMTPLHPLYWHLWCMCACAQNFCVPNFYKFFYKLKKTWFVQNIRMHSLHYITPTVNSFNAKQIKFYFVMKSWCEDRKNRVSSED